VVEQKPEELRVDGSIPSPGTIICQMPLAAQSIHLSYSSHKKLAFSPLNSVLLIHYLSHSYL
jgi:hypothetical protein